MAQEPEFAEIGREEEDNDEDAEDRNEAFSIDKEEEEEEECFDPTKIESGILISGRRVPTREESSPRRVLRIEELCTSMSSMKSGKKRTK